TYLRYPDGNAISYYRDGLDRLYYSQASNGWPLFYPVFDAAQELSGLWRWSLGAGTWSQANGFGYDNAHRLSALTQDLAGGAYDFSTSLTRNPASQIVSRTRDNDVYAWTGQVGVSRGYTTNGLNQYTASGSASFTYDPNGNLTSDG